MTKEVTQRILKILCIMIFAVLILLEVPSDDMTDYLLAFIIGVVVSISGVPKEEPNLMYDKIATYIIIFTPIIALVVIMPIWSVFFYVLGVILTTKKHQGSITFINGGHYYDENN